MTTRQFSRIRFHVDAVITAGDRKFSGAVENLSMNGMFLVTDERLMGGEPVDITITLTGSTPPISVSFSGHASRITEDGIGFQFEKIDLDSYSHLKNIITYNSEDAEAIIDEIHLSIDRKLASESD